MHSGHAVFVANYFGSTVASYRIQSDGTLSNPVDIIDFNDKQKFGSRGPNSARQDIPHPHCALFRRTTASCWYAILAAMRSRSSRSTRKPDI